MIGQGGGGLFGGFGLFLGTAESCDEFLASRERKGGGLVGSAEAWLGFCPGGTGGVRP